MLTPFLPPLTNTRQVTEEKKTNFKSQSQVTNLNNTLERKTFTSNNDQVKKIIEQGLVDVNCHRLYFYTNISKKVDYHSRQCFEYVQSGGVTLQLFERIDDFAGDDAKNLLLLLKV